MKKLGGLIILQVNINEKEKIVELWLTSKENAQANLPQNIEKLIEKYKEKKFRVCMYQSGNEDIKINLLNLLLNNT